MLMINHMTTAHCAVCTMYSMSSEQTAHCPLHRPQQSPERNLHGGQTSVAIELDSNEQEHPISVWSSFYCYFLFYKLCGFKMTKSFISTLSSVDKPDNCKAASAYIYDALCKSLQIFILILWKMPYRVRLNKSFIKLHILAISSLSSSSQFRSSPNEGKLCFSMYSWLDI